MAELSLLWLVTLPLPTLTLIAPFAVVATMPGPWLPLTKPAPVVIARPPAPVALALMPIAPLIAPVLLVAMDTLPCTFGEERCRAIGIGKAAIAEVADRTAAAIKLEGIKVLGNAHLAFIIHCNRRRGAARLVELNAIAVHRHAGLNGAVDGRSVVETLPSG